MLINTRAVFLFSLLTIQLDSAVATFGVDVSEAISVDAFKCLKSHAFDFAVVRVYQETGRLDPNAVQTMKNAWAAGMAHVDGYIYPCLSCGNPAQQVIDTVNHLRQSAVPFGMIWFDIEGRWSSNPTTNINFIRSMINQANSMGIRSGIYTSHSQWAPITDDSHEFASSTLWYPHYDNNPSFSDFVSFGGWTHPSIKQFIGTTSLCGVGVDKNFY